MEKTIEAKEFKFKTRHLFKILKVVNKTNILNDFKELWLEANAGDASKEELQKIQNEAGFDAAILALESLDKAEAEIYDLLADLEGKTTEEIEEQDAMETIESVTSIIQSDTVQGFLKRFTE